MIKTTRLLLEPIDSDHLDALTAMNADPAVMAHFPAPLTKAESTAQLERLRAHWQNHNFGYCALIGRNSGEFIGFTGLARPNYEMPFSPCVEIGWRLRRNYWGQGLAYEAARACLTWGFDTLALNEIVSFTARQNLRSQALMKRLGMVSSPAEDFEHPMLEIGHTLSWHVLFRLSRP